MEWTISVSGKTNQTDSLFIMHSNSTLTCCKRTLQNINTLLECCCPWQAAWAGVLLSLAGCLVVLVGGIMAREDRDYVRGGAKRTLPLAATSFLLSTAHQRSLRNMYFQSGQSFIWGPAPRDMEGEREEQGNID